MQIGNRLVGAGIVVVDDEVYTCTKTADGQRLWNTGDRRLTVSNVRRAGPRPCANATAWLRSNPQNATCGMDAAVGADMGSDYGSLGVS